jgi:hypothetical protein
VGPGTAIFFDIPAGYGAVLEYIRQAEDPPEDELTLHLLERDLVLRDVRLRSIQRLLCR